jgi:hypothetical protein
MRIASFVLGSVALLIQHYADKYQQIDFTQTLAQLDADLNLPRIRQYDFIVGQTNLLISSKKFAFKLEHNF